MPFNQPVNLHFRPSFTPKDHVRQTDQSKSLHTEQYILSHRRRPLIWRGTPTPRSWGLASTAARDGAYAGYSWSDSVLGVPSGSCQRAQSWPFRPRSLAGHSRGGRGLSQCGRIGTLARAQSASPKWNPDRRLVRVRTVMAAASHSTPTGPGHPADAQLGFARQRSVRVHLSRHPSAIRGTPDRGDANRVCRLPREDHRCLGEHHLHQRGRSSDHDPYERSLRWQLASRSTGGCRLPGCARLGQSPRGNRHGQLDHHRFGPARSARWHRPHRGALPRVGFPAGLGDQQPAARRHADRGLGLG